MNKTEYAIREMNKNDFQNVAAIYCEALKSGKSTFQSICPSQEIWDASHLPQCRMVIVHDNTVAGWCALSATSKREAYRGVAEVSIYIAKKFHGHGFGEALLTQLCRESEFCGFWCLYSSIFSINTASIKLHEKCGFRKIGYREKIAKDIFGNWQDTTLFEKRSNLIKE